MMIENIVEYALKNEVEVNRLLAALDSTATDYDHWEYGLPMTDPGSLSRMREDVYRWLLSLKEKTQE